MKAVLNRSISTVPLSHIVMFSVKYLRVGILPLLSLPVEKD